MKQAVLKVMRATGAFTPFRLANRSKALILTYHRFSRSDGGTATSARLFAEQLQYLRSHYRIVPLSEITDRLTSDAALPRGIAAITIDDGYADAYEIAFPILRQYQAPATVFVVTDFLDRKAWLWTDKLRFLTARARAETLEISVGGRDLRLGLNGSESRLQAATRVNSFLKTIADEAKDDIIGRIASALGVSLPALPPREFSPLTWEQAREMDAAGVEIGSHTVTHPILTNVSDEQLRRELRESRERLRAALGHDVDLFCYPNGDCDARVRREVANAGYRCAVIDRYGFNDKNVDVFALYRIHTECDLPHFVQSTSGFEQVKNRLWHRRPAGPAA